LGINVHVTTRKQKQIDALRGYKARRMGQFAKFIMPIIRNMPDFALIDALMPLQPMDGLPAGTVHVLDYVYGPRTRTRRER
jgi:hypothetical protein